MLFHRMTEEQVREVAAFACEVVIQKMLHGGRRTHGMDPDQNHWTENIEGYAGEMVFSLRSGGEWFKKIVPTQEPGDVSNVEVRTTHYTNGRLIIRDDDPLDRPFVLVRGKIPNFYIVGWILKRDLLKDPCQAGLRECERNRPEAWFVPEHWLTAIDYDSDAKRVVELGEQLLAERVKATNGAGEAA